MHAKEWGLQRSAEQEQASNTREGRTKRGKGGAWEEKMQRHRKAGSQGVTKLKRARGQERQVLRRRRGGAGNSAVGLGQARAVGQLLPHQPPKALRRSVKASQ